MFFRAEYRKEPARLADVLLWSTLVAGPVTHRPDTTPPALPTIIGNRDGALMATMRYRGPDVAMMDKSEWARYLDQMNRLLKRLGTGWALWADEWHEPVTEYPPGRHTTATSYFVDQVRKTVAQTGTRFEGQYFLTLAWLPPSLRQRRWYDTLLSTRAQRQAHEEDTLHCTQFQGALTKFRDALGLLLPEAVWCTPAETLGYLHQCVSWDRQRVQVMEVPDHLGYRLATAPLTHGVTPRLGSQYLCPIAIKTWPGSVGMTVPTALQYLQFPYRFTVRYLPLDKHQAHTTLKRSADRWKTQAIPLKTHLTDAWNGTTTHWDSDEDIVNQEARENAKSLERALRSLEMDEVSYGYCTPTVLVWGSTLDEAAEREREVIKILQSYEFVVEKEETNATRAWLGTLPGDAYNNVRNPLLASRVLAALLPHGTAWSGPRWDTHLQGPPLLLAESDGAPFRLVLHQGEVGNTMVIGPTRTGKSGLLGLMAMQFLERYAEAQLFCFDKDHGLYGATTLAEGTYYDFGGETPLGLQPLARLDEGEHEQRWAFGWVQGLLSAQGFHLTPEEHEELWTTVQRVAARPRHLRTVSTFQGLLQAHRLKAGLQPYMQGGPYSFCDSAADTFTIDGAWTTFEMRHLMAMPEALPHVLRYLFHVLARRFDGRPTLIVLDEARKLLTDPTFAPEILDYLKERAKMNVSVVLSTQEIADAASTALWQAICGSVRTWIYLPNSAALKREVHPYYTACGLPDAHIALLAQAQPLQDYLYTSDVGSRMFQLHLTPWERALVAASKPEEYTALRARARDLQGDALAIAWLEQQGFDEAATLYAEYASSAREATHA